MNEKVFHLARVMFAAILLLAGIVPAMPSPVRAQGNPDFSIGMAFHGLSGLNWPLDTPVWVTVDDPGTPEFPDFQDMQYPYLSPWDPEMPMVEFIVDIPLKAGFVVEMSNGATTVTHTVAFHVVAVSLLYDQVVGKALPGSEVTVGISDGQYPTTAIRRETADMAGNWTADFSQPGEDPDEQVLIDFAAPGLSVSISPTGGDLNTYYIRSMPAPFLRVFLNLDPGEEFIRSPHWPADTAVSIQIDDPATTANPDYQETQTSYVHPRYSYINRVDFYLDGFQIRPGMRVTMTDGFTAVIEHTVIDLGATDFDLVNEVVCGYALPNSQVDVEIDDDVGTAIRYVPTDAAGHWCANFAAPGPSPDEWQTVDMIPGLEGLVLQYDQNLSNSIKGFIIPSGPDIDGDGIPDLSDPCPADPTDTCNPDGSTAEVVGAGGGTLVTENQAVSMTVPAGALEQDATLSITDAGSGLQVTDQGQAQAVLSVDIGPSGTTFASQVAITLEWPDADQDGVVDGTALLESALVVTKDGVVITQMCAVDPGCDPVANTFTVYVSSFSTFALGALLAPKIESLSATAEPVQVGASVQASAVIQDAEQGDTYTVTWDWGDGTITTENTSGAVLQAAHTYDQPGVYPLTLTVDEGEAGSATATYQFVVIYDPQGGFVTGGGWINSPEGACRLAACSDGTTGKANFGFVSKYQKGSSVPTGNTEFSFKAGDLNFRSTSYQWLVVAGSKAMYKGYGKVNGGGNYGFLISAVDAALSSATAVDLFRIKIWDLQTGVVVYDNQMAAPEDATPTTAIGGGSIVIHKK